MDDPFLVRRFQRLRDLARDRDRFIHGQAASPGIGLGEASGERRSFHQLEHQPIQGVGLLEAVDRSYVRVIQRRQQPRLALQPAEPLGIGGESRG